MNGNFILFFFIKTCKIDSTSNKRKTKLEKCNCRFFISSYNHVTPCNIDIDKVFVDRSLLFFSQTDRLVLPTVVASYDVA